MSYLRGINCYIDLNKQMVSYIKASEKDDTVFMRRCLKKINDILTDENLMTLFPKDFVIKLQVALNNITEKFVEIDKVNANSKLSSDDKKKKITKLKKDLNKAELDFNKILKNNFNVFLSTLRTDLAKNSYNDGVISDVKSDEELEYIDNVDDKYLSDDDKKLIKNEINRLNAEELTIKEDKGKIGDNGEYNLETAADKVDADDLSNTEYSKDVMANSLALRLQQINKEIIDLKKQYGNETNNYSLNDAVKLQSLITQQSDLTKELISLKRGLLQTFRDLKLNSAKNGIERTNIILENHFKGKGKISTFVREKLQNHLSSLKEKKGTLIAKQKLNAVKKIEKKARKLDNQNRVYSSVAADFFINNRLEDLSFAKKIQFAAMPKRIMLANLDKKQDILYTR